MLLLHLLRLLLVLLFQLLRSRFGCIPLRVALVLLILLLLEFLPFPILLCVQLFLLFLIFLILLVVARVWSRTTLRRWNILGMHDITGPGPIVCWTIAFWAASRLVAPFSCRATISRRMVWRSSRLGRHHRASTKLCRPCSGRDRWLALVQRGM